MEVFITHFFLQVLTKEFVPSQCLFASTISMLQAAHVCVLKLNLNCSEVAPKTLYSLLLMSVILFQGSGL